MYGLYSNGISDFLVIIFQNEENFVQLDELQKNHLYMN